MGKVFKIYSDGDLRVQLDGHAWTLHPQCVRLIPGSATELANTMHALQNQRQEPSSMYIYHENISNVHFGICFISSSVVSRKSRSSK